MGVPRHYMKLSPVLEEYVRQIAPGTKDWESAVFQDITENGTTLIVERLQPNDQRARIGLCGDRFYCEAGPDRERDDCLFVFKVSDAIRRTPKSLPQRYPATIYPFEWRNSEQLDTTAELWKGQTSGVVSSLSASVEPFNRNVNPSEQLLKMLASIPPDVRKEWQPEKVIEEPQSAEGFLKLLRRPWARFKLELHVNLAARQDSLLKGLIPNASLGRQERLRLLALFDIGLLNAFARSANSAESSLKDLLRALALLPLAAEARARVWSAIARTLNADDFARELTEIAAQFNHAPHRHRDLISGWWPAIEGLLTWRVNTIREGYLSDLLDECQESHDPIRSLCEWVTANISVGTDATTSPSEAQEVSANVDEHKDDLRKNEEKTKDFSSRLSASPIKPTLQKWFLALHGIDNDNFDSILGGIRSTATRLIAICSDHGQLDAISKLVKFLPDVRADVQDWISVLPSANAMGADFDEVSRAYDQASSLIGSDLDGLLQTSRPSLRDITEASNLLQNEDVIRALPQWVWANGKHDQKPSRTDVFRQLVLPEIREAVVSVLSAAGEFGTFDPFLIALIPPPPPIEDLDSGRTAMDQHVRAWFERMGALLKDLPEGLLTELRKDLEPTSVEARIRQALGLGRKLRDRLPSSVVLEAMQDVIRLSSERDVIERAEQYVAAVNFWETNFGGSSAPAFAQLKSWVDKQTRRAPTGSPHPEGRSSIRIENNWIDTHGAKVPLLFNPSENQSTKPYGYVAIPMVAISKQKRPITFEIECDVKSGHRDGWPRDWESPQPSMLQISEETWRDDPEQPDQYLYTFKLNIPIRRHARGQRFEFTLTLKQDNRIIAGPFSFSWDVINDLAKSPLVISWPEGVDPKNVEKNPLGPQKKSTDILSRVAQCGSFSITAPRRFGKSTLLEFLRISAERSGFVVPDPILCTSYYSGQQGLDYEKLWQDVSDRLQRMVGSSITRSENPAIPSEHAFDHVRKSAKERGKRGITLLFDEAQLYFSSRSGTITGDQVKDRLERYWSLQTNEMVPLTLGFIGLPTLQIRAGANLNGLLRPIQFSVLEETDLKRLILAVTNGSLHTTREARVRLARVAGNLYTLRTLIEKLAEHISDDGRSWANYDDVHTVEMDLRTALRIGEEQTLAFYIRDILNDSEDINSWQPSPALPLAIAFADARRRHSSASRVEDEAKAIVSAWFDSLAGDEKISLTYSDQQFTEHFRILEERGVLRDKEFSSVLIEDWLQGFVRKIDDREWKLLLQTSATRRIKIPGMLRSVSTGGEADIRCSISESDKLAYRFTPLRTEDDRHRFLQTKEVLENLKNKIADGAPGAEFIFRISDVGLSAESESEAVQVYRWVDGVDLSKRAEELPAVYVTDLGIKLSKALHFLHSNNLVHRDICPRNIVLADEGGDPVIIDFGFARWLAPNLKTNIGGEFSAPEVKRQNVEWTKAADVYSLGATLKNVLRVSDTCASLNSVITDCMKDSPEARPDALQLIRRFDEASKGLHVERKKETVWRELQAVCAADLQSATWYKDVFYKFEGNFVAVALGCHPRQFDRCREAANFLNQVFERWAARNPNGLTIALVKDENSFTGKKLATDAIKFVHWMRNQHSHSRYSAKLPSFVKVSPEPEKRMVELSLDAAVQIGNVVGLSCLEKAIGSMISAHRT